MLGHSYVSNDNSNNEDFSKAYCRIKGILLLSLFSPPVDYIPIKVGMGKTLRDWVLLLLCLALTASKLFHKTPTGFVFGYFYSWGTWFIAMLSRKKQLENYEHSESLGPGGTGATDWLSHLTLNHLPSCLAHQKTQWLVGAELAASTTTCRHSAHRSKAMETAHFPPLCMKWYLPHKAVLTQGIPAW